MSGSEDGMVKPTPVMGYGAPSRSYTGATLREASGLPVAVAFNAGNLEAVARAARERWPDKRIGVAGDDDRHLEQEINSHTGQPKKNVGREKAEAAAEAVGAFTLFPKFGAGERGTDWNDLAQAKGEAEAQKQVQAGLASAERRGLAAGVKAQRQEAEPKKEQARGRGQGR
jgi:putative DNA primase/helicase